MREKHHLFAAIGLVLLAACDAPSAWTQDGDRWVVSRDQLVARVGRGSLELGSDEHSTFHVETAVTVGSQSLDGVSAPIVDGDVVRRELSGRIEERTQVVDDGVEQSWLFRQAPPDSADVSVSVRVEGAHATVEDERGWHFVAGERGVRVEPATWIDANGVRTQLVARAEDDVVTLTVPAEVLARSAYPAVLDPVIGPELPVDAPATDLDVPYGPNSAAVAFDGTNYLVVWLENHPYPSTTSYDIMGAQVRASDGVLLDPGGFLLYAGVSAMTPSGPDVAFDGTRFLLVWQMGGDIQAERVSITGGVIGARFVVSSAAGTQSSPSIACRANECLAVWSDGRTAPASTIGTRIDTATGTVRDPIGLVFAASSGATAVATDGTDYLVAWGTATGERATRVRESDGAPLDTTPLMLSAASSSSSAMAFAGGSYVVGWDTGTTALAARIRPSDGMILDATPVTLSPSVGTEVSLTATSTGADSAFAWSVPNPTDFDVRGTIMRSSDGTLVNAAGFTIAGGTGDQGLYALTAGPAGQMLAVVNDGRLAARRVSTVDGSALDASSIPVGVMANEERTPATASDGTNHLVVWVDSRVSPARIYGARVMPNGTPIDAPARAISDGAAVVGAPAVAYGAGEYLVVWQDSRGATIDVYGARVRASDGVLLDTTSLLIFTATGSQTKPSVAFDGTNFVTTWDDSRGTPYSVNVRPADGSVTNPLGAPLSGTSGRNPAITCNPATCLVAWRTSASVVQAVRIAGGSVLDATPLAVAPNEDLGRVDVATDGTDFLVTYDVLGSGFYYLLTARRVSSSTGTVGAAMTIHSSAAVNTPDSDWAVAYDGATYEVAWTDTGHVGVVRAQPSDGAAIGASTITFSGSTTTQSTIAISSNGAGTSVLAYDWPDYYTPPNGGWRVRIRSSTAGAPNGASCSLGGDCTSGFCVDSVCCNTACAGGTTDCQACSVAAGAAVDGTCAPASATHVCRASAAPCDAAETCDGASTVCPPNVNAPAGTVCRAPVDLCDRPEVCSGTTTTCPADTNQPSGTVCRPAVDPFCDSAETCSGSSRTCPTDTFRSGMTCRPSAGACDPAEVCSGFQATCPMDLIRGAGSSCRPVAGPCDVPETCDGVDAACPADGFVAAGTECRASMAVCDIAETCTGSAAACPVNGLAPSGTVCRASTGTCDPAETCNGRLMTCPADVTGCPPTDAAVLPDAGTTSSDGGTTSDAATSPDAATPPNDAATPMQDAGTTMPDAALTRDAGSDGGTDGSIGDASATDATIGMDTGTGAPVGTRPGCACSTTPSRPPWALGGLGLVVAFARVRRRRKQ